MNEDEFYTNAEESTLISGSSNELSNSRNGFTDEIEMSSEMDADEYTSIWSYYKWV
ncbi:hypothetical protein [Flavobacterium sp. DG2-3]|uniref:hypothetical protein n=1 Tax=Flavobacterium sp. DG2-3 TaxID=3068317 RepID=UPI00273F82C3|nr:hypothetical protein [Flavobacterium sp. DG2-3]MDP5199119.1 hypothetical protein [Flavobacterium sp. DG2-3]